MLGVRTACRAWAHASIALAFVVGCANILGFEDSSPEAESCASNADCSPGRICVEGECRDSREGRGEVQAGGTVGVAGDSGQAGADGGTEDGGGGGASAGSTTVPGTGGQDESGGSESGGSEVIGEAGGTDEPTGGNEAAGGTARAGAAATTGGVTGGTDASGGTASGTGNTGGTGDPQAGSAGQTMQCGQVDCCPDNPDKDDPGKCGCDEPDIDNDGDGSFNCEDNCPEDESKTEPGDCGCGREETPECAALIAAMVHRYSFKGTGTAVTDSVGSADGQVVNTTLAGTGSLSLAGGTSDQYVDLPNGIVSSLTDATFEVWVTWAGGQAWQRIFDFGSSDAGEDAQGTAQTYLALTPQTLDSSGALRVFFSTGGVNNEVYVDGSAALGSGVAQVAVVVDDTNDTLQLYRDGEPEGNADFAGQLSDLDDVNNWLGQSQFSADEDFGGTIDEFRIYDAALSAAEIQYSYDAGPDAGFLN